MTLPASVLIGDRRRRRGRREKEKKKRESWAVRVVESVTTRRHDVPYAHVLALAEEGKRHPGKVEKMRNEEYVGSREYSASRVYVEEKREDEEQSRTTVLSQPTSGREKKKK